MTLAILAGAALVLAAIPAALTLVNLAYYRPPRAGGDTSGLPPVSILIPARNEEPRIARAVEAALASRGVEVEVVVMDDHSTDRTAQIVRDLAGRHPNLRLERAPELPRGWGGKPHACHTLAARATAPVLAFVDADVVLEPDGIARAVRFLVESGADLCSGFPRQRTGSLAEKLVIPLIHFVLLGYLPMPGMRGSRSEAFAAGCGQLIVTRRGAYDRAGGHASVRTSFHDGVKLPRAFRREGLVTDLFDATPLASVRMYGNAGELVAGLAKNAHEGMGGPVSIWVWSVLLLGGHVLPALLVAAGFAAGATDAPWFLPALAATAVGIANRLVLAAVFRQSWIGALLHPLGVALLVAIQWYARARRRSGSRIRWKERVQLDD